MAQDCGLAYESGPGAFRVDLDGNGAVDTVVTFIADPVEPGVVWMRHRQFVLRAGPTAGEPTVAVPTVMAPTTAPTVRPDKILFFICFSF